MRSFVAEHPAAPAPPGQDNDPPAAPREPRAQSPEARARPAAQQKPGRLQRRQQLQARFCQQLLCQRPGRQQGQTALLRAPGARQYPRHAPESHHSVSRLVASM